MPDTVPPSHSYTLFSPSKSLYASYDINLIISLTFRIESSRKSLINCSIADLNVNSHNSALIEQIPRLSRWCLKQKAEPNFVFRLHLASPLASTYLDPKEQIRIIKNNNKNDNSGYEIYATLERWLHLDKLFIFHFVSSLTSARMEG